VLDVLRALEAGSVHCVVTSTPYWSLRDYQLPPVEWEPVRYAPMAGLPEIEVPGCDPECKHKWGKEQVIHQRGSLGTSTLDGRKPVDGQDRQQDASQGSWCRLCGGWRGSLGLEPTPEMFVGHIVAIWRELRRVLRDDGTCWLNLGDSYCSIGHKKSHSGFGTTGLAGGIAQEHSPTHRENNGPGLKHKDLLGIPWRVALALQADGWYLRSAIVWAKGLSFCDTYSGSCMPESVRDRPTTSYEMVFLLAKSERYYYDADAVREGYSEASLSRYNYAFGGDGYKSPTKNPSVRPDGVIDPNPAGRNLRSVWTINPGSYAGAHFATFPPALMEPMIKAGTSERGCCPQCGAPWERVTDVSYNNPGNRTTNGPRSMERRHETAGFEVRLERQSQTIGFRPTCSCYDDLYRRDFPKPKNPRKRAQRLAWDWCEWTKGWFKRARRHPGLAHWPTVPCTVLDLFLGSGTTADVARQLDRRWQGIELSKDYCDEHIIPRLEEPLIEWAQEEQPELAPEAEQLSLL